MRLAADMLDEREEELVDHSDALCLQLVPSVPKKETKGNFSKSDNEERARTHVPFVNVRFDDEEAIK